MNTITKPEDAPTYVQVTYDAVVSYFKAHLSESCPEGPTDWASRNLLWPRVFPPGHDGRTWVIVWLGPVAWPTLVASGGRDEFGAAWSPMACPRGVGVDAVSSDTLMVYQETGAKV